MAILDQQMPHPETVPYRDLAVRTGAVIALILTVLGLVMYVADLNEALMRNKALNWGNNLLSFGIAFWFIFSALKNHRQNDLGGYLSTGRGIGFGTLAGVVMGIVSAVWVWVFMTYVDTELIEVIRRVTIEDMERKGLDEGQIEESMKYAAPFMSAGFIASMTVFFGIFTGFLAGLFSGLILKRQPSTM